MKKKKQEKHSKKTRHMHPESARNMTFTEVVMQTSLMSPPHFLLQDSVCQIMEPGMNFSVSLNVT